MTSPFLTSLLQSGIPSGITIASIFTLIVIAVSALVFYALRIKGDVRAEFSHGSTQFKLEAKDRQRNSRRSRKDH